MKKVLFSLTSFFFIVVSITAQNVSPYWSLSGNSNATSSSKLGTTNATDLKLYTNNLERMRITSSGNVGIGTTNLTSKFIVNSVTGKSPFKVQINGTSKLFVHSNGGVAIGALATPFPNGLFVAGKVGINTDPGVSYDYAKLDVNGSANIAPRGDSIIYYAALTVFNETAAHGLTGILTKGSSRGIDASGSTGVYGSGADGGGGVGVYGIGDGIGVYGTSTDNVYAGYFNGDVYSSATYQGSDAKLKKNITNVNNALDIINQLQPRNYEYREDGNFGKMKLPQGKHFGFIAQDMEKVLPNLVKQTKFNVGKLAASQTKLSPSSLPFSNIRPATIQPDTEIKEEAIDFKAVNYIELIPITVKAIQEQQNQIKEQNIKIKEQQQQIDELKSMVLSMKNLSANSTINSSAFIKQNSPNPSNNTTVITYYTPDETRNAQILITDVKGSVLKAYNVSKGQGQLNIKTGELATGTYNYTLYVNSAKIETKQMIIAK